AAHDALTAAQKKASEALLEFKRVATEFSAVSEALDKKALKIHNRRKDLRKQRHSALWRVTSSRANVITLAYHGTLRQVDELLRGGKYCGNPKVRFGRDGVAKRKHDEETSKHIKEVTNLQTIANEPKLKDIGADTEF